MTELVKKKCIPCQGGVPPLKGNELQELIRQLNGWKLIEEHHIEKSYKFKEFEEALGFVNRVAKVAQEENHHPDINLTVREVKLTLWTHKIDGLTESDFIFAAKADEVI